MLSSVFVVVTVADVVPTGAEPIVPGVVDKGKVCALNGDEAGTADTCVAHVVGVSGTGVGKNNVVVVVVVVVVGGQPGSVADA